MRRLLVVLVLAGCADSPMEPEPVETGPIFGQERIDPVPASYAEWYAEVEACLTVTGDFDAVRWFVADSIIIPAEPPYHLDRRIGLWIQPHDIVIVRGEEHREVFVKIYSVRDIMQDPDPFGLHDVNGRVRCW